MALFNSTVAFLVVFLLVLVVINMETFKSLV